MSRLKARPHLSKEDLRQASECLKALAHPVRLRMLQLLLSGRYTVGELAEECEIRSHMASEHLRLLQRCQILISEREGRKTYYAVAEPHIEQMLACIEKRFGG
ncbi:MAG TPA: ArsR family transcriptional regulator [Planctomycetes bacterium]|nr:ArsR family transcriptional regulator [Planctomycetota bacterium]HIN81155.1 ArsR family transcriptional regulator [Planctomycetota bacterium]